MFGSTIPHLAPDGEGQNESAIIAEDLENPEILASHSRHAIRLVLHEYHALALPQFYFRDASINSERRASISSRRERMDTRNTDCIS
jgi:hypothetical protein